MTTLFAPKTINELTEYPVTKHQAFQNFDGAFDYSLPQHWLDNVADYALKNGYSNVTYDLILSTTIWYYEKLGYGAPLTCCCEVGDLIEQYNNSL